MLCCKSHWYALPKPLRDAIWDEYTSGQENTKTPTLRYLAVQRLSIAFLARADVVVHAELMTAARKWRKRAIDLGQGDPFIGLESFV